MSYQCYRCGGSQAEGAGGSHPFVARKDSCSCGADLHVCKNCEFYDAGAHHECRESQAEYVKDKERSNFCDYFKFSKRGKATDNKAAAMAKLDDLFKK